MRFTQGRVSVTISDDLERMIRRTIERSAPTLVPVIDEASKAILLRALPLWPVRTGASKASLAQDLRVSQTSVAGVISDGARYAYMIRFAKGTENAGKNVWKTLVTDPIREASKEVAKKCGSEIAALMLRKS